MIRIEFTGDDPQQLAHEILTVGYLISARATPKTDTVPAPEVTPDEPEKAEDKPKRGPGRPKKTEPAKEQKDEPDETAAAGDAAEDGTEAGTADTSPDEAAGAASSDDGNGSDAGEATETEAEKADEPVMTVDDLRKYTLDEYLLKHFKGLDAQKAEFRTLLDKFEVKNIGDLPADAIGPFKAEVDKRIGEAG